MQNITLKYAFYFIVSCKYLASNAFPLTLNWSLTTLLDKIQSETAFQTLVVIRSSSVDNNNNNNNDLCISNRQLKLLNTPYIILHASNRCTTTLRKRMNNNILLLHCLDGPYFNATDMTPVLQSLGRLRSAPFLFYWHQQPYDVNLAVAQLHDLFTYCSNNSMLNVISIFGDFTRSQRYYGYTRFPHFRLESQQLQLQQHCFPDRLLNMHGAAIRTLPERNEPRSLAQYDKRGNVVIHGYIAEFVQSFARKHNATLAYPLSDIVNSFHFRQHLHNMTINGTIDIPMTLSSPVRINNFDEYSAIFEQTAWRVMIPLSKPLSASKVCLYIFNSIFGVIVLLLLFAFTLLLTLERIIFERCHSTEYASHTVSDMAIVSLRGVIGHAIQHQVAASTRHRLIFILLFASGIFVTTVTVTYAKTYFVKMPRPQEINTFDDMLNAGMEIHIAPEDYPSIRNYTGNTFWQRYKHLFVSTDNAQEFYMRRTSLDTSNAYTINDLLWDILNSIQQRLRQPLFHVTEQTYLNRGLYLAMPQHEHSIYREALNRLIGQVWETGLLHYWRRTAIWHMIKSKISVLRPLPFASPTRSLNVTDFYYVWWGYGIGMTVSVIAFILERLNYSRTH